MRERPSTSICRQPLADLDPLAVTIVFVRKRTKHNEIPSFIPFSLYLGGTKVNNGTPIIWDNLSFGNGNLRDLHVGNINYQSAISKMGGSYSDTITVNISSLDGNLVGH